MSYSNNRDLGNFDQCMTVNYESFEGDVKGKFCPLSVAIANPFLTPIPDPFKIIVKPKSLADVEIIEMRDLKETPPVTMTALSLCIPDQCTPREVGKYFLWGQFGIANTSLVYFVDNVPCVTKDANTEFEGGDIAYT